MGHTYNDIPHKYGRCIYKDGTEYKGEYLFGYFDGYGTYIFSDKSIYQGFFMSDKFNGIGTYENNHIITKGSWREDKKHGIFTTTEKNTFTSYTEIYIHDKLYKKKNIQYTPPSFLRTIKKIKKNKKLKSSIKSKKCIICYDNPPNCTNIKCGHITCCYDMQMSY